MSYTHYTIHAHLWQYPGMSGWHFVTIPPDISEDITHLFRDRKKGWGSLRVRVTLGRTVWETSIFPDTKEGTYLLPMKQAIRKQEKLRVGDALDFTLEIL